LVNKLREAGVSLQKIRIALKNIQKVLGDDISISDVSVFSDGKSIYVISDNDQMIDLLKKGQAVFGISLGPVHSEAEAKIFSLYPDKVSAENA
jgi:hypothetical protein